MKINGDQFLADMAADILSKSAQPMRLADIIEKLRTRRSGIKYHSVNAALQKLVADGRAERVPSGGRNVAWRIAEKEEIGK